MPLDPFLEVDHCQVPAQGQRRAGDVFLSRRLDDGRRVVSVLADGLAKGAEAASLAAVSAAMALEYVDWNIDTERAAEILMDSLPVDPLRGISYSTFTIVDARTDGRVRVLEHGNPPFALLRAGAALEVPRREHHRGRWGRRRVAVSEFQAQVGDRLVFCSDGVGQSGMGSEALPLGWGDDQATRFVADMLRRHPDVSARRVAEGVAARALHHDGGRAGDDITCGVLHLRHPRVLYLLTGPPYDEARDPEFARLLETPGVRKAVCGGTTSNIVARELRRELEMDLSSHDREVPACSHMEGVDLVTEGCMTLAKVAEYLEAGACPRRNAASRLVDLLLESDIVHVHMGTRVNEAHQDPALPVELDIRRNVLRRIASLLETRHLRTVHLTCY